MTSKGKYQGALDKLIADELPQNTPDAEPEYRSYSLVVTLIVCVILISAGIFFGFSRIPQHPEINEPDYSEISQEPEVLLESCKKNITLLSRGVDFYAHEHGGQLPQSLEEVYQYCKFRPKCPRALRDTYSSGFTVEGDKYVIKCCGHWHGAARMPSNFPCFNSDKGFLEP